MIKQITTKVLKLITFLKMRNPPLNSYVQKEIQRSIIWAKLQGGYNITPEEQLIVRLTDEQLQEQYRRFCNPDAKR